jgi:hypothetical protein
MCVRDDHNDDAVPSRRAAVNCMSTAEHLNQEGSGTLEKNRKIVVGNLLLWFLLGFAVLLLCLLLGEERERRVWQNTDPHHHL